MISKIIPYFILILFYASCLIGCGALFAFANNDSAGLLAIPIFLFVFLGYFYLLKFYPNNYLTSIADYKFFVKSVFIIMAIMGCILLISYFQQSNLDDLSYIGRTGKDPSTRKKLHIIVIIILISPFLIQRIFFPERKPIIMEEDADGNVTFK